ncbi:MAG: hypothetical protein ABJB03_00425 [Rhodoglobus sp.]
MSAEYPSWVGPSQNLFCVAAACRLNPNTDEGRRAVKLTGRADTARFAVPGTDLCAWHHDHFKRVLTDLLTTYPDLERALYRRPSGESNSPVKTSTVSDISSSWNPHATEMLSAVAEWTEYIVRVIITQRPTPPSTLTTWPRAEVVFQPDGSKTTRHWMETKTVEYSHGINPSAPTRLALGVIVSHHAHWLSSYPDLGPAWMREAEKLRINVMNAIDAQPVRRVGLRDSWCQETVDELGDDQLTCSAPMVGILGQDNRPSLVVCAAHPKTHRTYTRDEWRTWIDTPTTDEPIWVSVGVAMLSLNVEEARARQIAVAEHWTTKAGSRPAEYLWSDITRTVEQRKALQ